MSLYLFKPFMAIVAAAALLTACGGKGSSAAPPVGGLSLEAGEAGVTVTWTAVPGVEYWLYGAPASTICKNCSTNDWKTISGAVSRGQSNAPITSPYFISGLTNDTVYAFIMDGRINGGPGGEATPSVSVTPRLAGSNWYAGGSLTTVNGIAHGAILDTATNTFATTGTYLSVGANGTKYQSTDGLKWTALSSTDSVNWLSATYALSKFIGVGAGGAVAFSNDLKTWTSAASGVTQNLNALATNGSMVVAVGNNGTILRSTDAVTWTAATSTPSNLNLYSVGYTVNGLWVAVGAAGTLLTSTDGATWTAVNSGTTADLKSVASLSNTVTTNNVTASVNAIVATGNSGSMLYSADGVTWTLRSLGTNANLNAVVASSGVLPTNQFVAVGDGGVAFTSSDGLTWTSRTTQTNQNLNGLIRANNQYLSWSANGFMVYTK